MTISKDEIKMNLIACRKLIVVLLVFFLFGCGVTETAVTPDSSPTPISPATSTQLSPSPVPTSASFTTPPTKVVTSTSSPLPTEPIATPADVAPSIEPFSLSTAGQVVPDDIFQEIAFFTGGDGGTGCLETFTQPTIISVEEEETLHDLVEIQSCGWQNNERIQIIITFPDGNVVSQEHTFQPQYTTSQLVFKFKTNVLTDPPGPYHIVFAGPSGTTETSFQLQEPSGPQFYWNEDNTLIMYNFQPQEAVRIFAYKPGGNATDNPGEQSYQLHAWQEFIVNENGILIIEPQFNVPIGWYAAVGEYSGEVIPLYPSSPPVWGIYSPTILAKDSASPPSAQETWPISDTGVEACHLSYDDLVTAAENARLWSQPDVTFARVVTSPAVGQQLTLSASPRWGRIRADIDASGWWWQVTTPDGQRGWIWQERIQECIN